MISSDSQWLHIVPWCSTVELVEVSYFILTGFHVMFQERCVMPGGCLVNGIV